MRKKLCLLLLGFLLSFSVKTQEVNKDKLDSLMNTIQKYNKGMGSLAILKDGKTIYSKAIGYKDVENKLMADEYSKYRIGSISKSFTSTIIIQLIEEKKLSFSDTLEEYFPGIINADKISISDLLRHRSGIYNFTNHPSYLEYMERPITKDSLTAKIQSLGSVFEPGLKAGYSNSNYVLLTLIAEKVDNKPFSEIVKSRITDRINLANTYVGGKIATENNECHSYDKKVKWKKSTQTDMSIPLGAGAIVSTAEDVSKFYHALFDRQLINEANLDSMSMMVDNYGMGLFQFPFYDKIASGHTGGIDGFHSMSGHFIDENLSITYLANGLDYPVNDIMIGALSIYFDKDYEIPVFTPDLVLSEEELEPFLGVYASPALPLKITISKEENALIAQATGQPSFVLVPYEKNKFKFDPANLKIEFIPSEGKLMLDQGMQFEFTKE